MDDLFAREQQILNDAFNHVNDVKNGMPGDPEAFETLAREYGKLLKQLRIVTKMSDKTAVSLNSSNLDLLDKLHYDVLTGIHNRRFLDETLKRVIKSLSRSGGILSVLMIDVDFFKKYNDTYGHNMGDICLKAIAGALAGSISRPDDFVARYGGEEFVIILSNADEKGARVISDKVLKNVRALNIPHAKNDAASCVTVSVGATTGKAKHMQSGSDYIQQADKALYMSKRGGRDRYTFISLEEDSQ